MPKSWIKHRPAYPKAMEAVKKAYDAQYVMTSSLRGRSGNWSDEEYDIYYQEGASSKHPSDYFGIIVRSNGSVMITSGESLEGVEIGAIMSSQGEILYSKSRHDYAALETNEGAIDGGRDYTKTISMRAMPLILHKGELVCVTDEARIHDFNSGFGGEENTMTGIRRHLNGGTAKGVVNFYSMGYPSLELKHRLPKEVMMSDFYTWLSTNLPDDYVMLGKRVFFSNKESLIQFKLMFSDYIELPS